MDLQRPCNTRLRLRRCGLLIVVCAFLAVDATAQTRIEAGYVHIESDNAFDSTNWESVDAGRGSRLAVEHDRGPLRIGFDYQRLNLDLRNSFHTIGCVNTFCRPVELYYEFTDRFRSYALSGAWTWAWSPKAILRMGGAVIHETWSNDGGIFHFRPSGLPTSLDESRSTDQTAWGVNGGIDLELSRAWALELGVNYQHKTYRAVVPESRRPAGPKPLLEGVARLTRRCGEHLDAFVELRPSDQRHYASLGVGYRF